MTEAEFIKLVKKECKYYGVKTKIKPVKYLIIDGIHCSGYFDAENKVLACATNRPDFLGILAHEYCHMRQWIEKDPTWMKAEEEDSYTEWERLRLGENIDREKHLSIIRDLELNNEMRTVEIIKKYNLPIDIPLYIKKSNAYIMFYNYMKITGKWCKKGNSPYNNENILAVMPDEFNLDYTVLPVEMQKVFREEKL
jgi:hypothetical protein